MKKATNLLLAFLLLITASSCSLKQDNWKPNYTSVMAIKNGDILRSGDKIYNIEKLERFVKNMKNNRPDKVRITNYTTEGDAIILDLVMDSKAANLAVDTTRDRFGIREKKEYQIVDIFKKEVNDNFIYYAKTSSGDELHLIVLKKDKSSTINFTNDIQIDNNYLNALNTADEFLSAWLHRDVKEGKKYLSKAIMEKYSDEELSWFISGISNPHHQGFEILGARKIDSNTIRFYVWLYEYVTGDTSSQGNRPEPRIMDIVRSGENQWLVGGLPRGLNGEETKKPLATNEIQSATVSINALETADWRLKILNIDYKENDTDDGSEIANVFMGLQAISKEVAPQGILRFSGISGKHYSGYTEGSLGQFVNIKNYNALGTIDFVMPVQIEKGDKIIMINYIVGEREFDIPVNLE